jgi:DNA mismatch repair protein MutS2
VIYPHNFEQKTGFDTIRRLIAGKCLSSLGEERTEEMSFSASYHTVATQLDRVDEFIRILHGDREFPSAYFFDLRSALKRIRPTGTFLDEKELFDLMRSLRTIHNMAGFLQAKEAGTVSYPALADLAADIRTFPQIVAACDAIVDPGGGIKDNASPLLLQIRREIADTASRISRSLHAILRAAQAEGVVEKDVAPTLRDGRLTIPVAPAFKRKIRGIVHDESASGKTVFIEPDVVVEANNRIRELEGDERREITRILTEMTDRIRPLAPDMLLAYEFMADIDFIRAKALFAGQVNAIRPSMDDRQTIDWTRAMHPTLYLSRLRQGKETIPLDIRLEEDKRLLLLSGPNAGGKSVCLKTVGLLQYMLQCGVPIPVAESSKTGIFDAIFIDIGDEQSIENDLSTYSSHLINMKFFLRHCNRQTLILIDEFGSGTEPRIGGAMAEALLDRFNRQGCYGVLTTHYQNLKRFAADNPGIANGAMLYDRNLMQPLFQLAIGRPGSSFAIEIARRTGLPEDLIDDVTQKAGADYISLDKYLQDIVRDKRYWESKRQAIRQQEKKLGDLAARYEQNLEAADKERKDILRQAQEEARKLVAEANARIENVIREIKEAQAAKEPTRTARKTLDAFKASVEDPGGQPPKPPRKPQTPATTQPRRPATDASPLARGDAVRLKGQSAYGTLLDVRGQRATVAFGVMKSSLDVSQLEKVDPARLPAAAPLAPAPANPAAEALRQKKLHFKREIDLRGMRADEALQATIYFIDDAILAGVSPVRILHGTGTGALRQLVRDYLAAADGVGGYRDEHVEFGGAGITVVEL